MAVWRPVIDNALVNVFVRKREWRLALISLEGLINGLSKEEGGGGTSVEREVDWWCSAAVGSGPPSGSAVPDEERQAAKDLILAASHVELLSRQLLILLQAGGMDAAEIVQGEVRRHAARANAARERSSHGTTLLARIANDMALARQAPYRVTVNEGLLLFARGKHTDAAERFRDALNQQRTGPGAALLSSDQSAEHGVATYRALSAPALGFAAPTSLVTECVNNLSLCLLYSGQMRSSVLELEQLVREEPCRYLTEGVAFNLCTMYELGSDGEECGRKKRLLQRVAKRFCLHDVGVESFRLA